jgi:DNA-binding XRE family transcriptional regulator
LPDKPVWNRERGRYADKMRKRGTPLMVTQAEFQAVTRLLEKARRYGMSDNMIADQVGVNYTLPSKVRRGAIKTMHRDTYNRVMQLRPQKPTTRVDKVRGKVGSGAYVDSTGTVRRMQALRADGFPGPLLGEFLGVSYEAVAQMARTTRKTVLVSTKLSMAKLYEELEGKTPGDFGVPSNVQGKCSTWARRAGYIPRSCWDRDTIDNPAARPEWTGRCGTVFGLMIHERDGIPACPACLSATGKLAFSGEKLKELRELHKLPQRDLETRAGLAKGQIHHYELGRYAPKRDRLARILSVLDATFEDVYEEVPSE